VTDTIGPFLENIQNASQYLANARPSTSERAIESGVCWFSLLQDVEIQFLGCFTRLDLLLAVSILLDESVCSPYQEISETLQFVSGLIRGDRDKVAFDRKWIVFGHVLPHWQWQR
jgi:hypothetical protein